MKTSAKIISDSVGPSGNRITTFQLTFPRFILPEFNTHRMFSRNASSSRAIPVKKQIENVLSGPFIPLSFNKNAKGMQGGEIVDSTDQDAASKIWLEARDAACKYANQLVDLGISKQYANRILEPFTWTTVVCTATEWNNFFALRCHPMAQPEIRSLADKMYKLYSETWPLPLQAGQWHLPFIKNDELSRLEWNGDVFDMVSIDTLLKCSVARCARVSYLNHDNTLPTEDQDLALYDRLMGQLPIHASPAEHQAMAVGDPNVRSGNFRGFVQYRKTIKDENITKFNGA
jgi:thymidylate synthase ThyX